MPAQWTHLSSRLAALLSLALLATLVPGVRADDFEKVAFQLFKKKNDCDCQPCPQITPAPEQIPAPGQKEPEKKEPEKKAAEVVPPALTQPPLVEAPETGPALGASGFSLASSNVGYLDPAIPMTCLRFRFDAAYDNVHPDRAEYFYAKYQSIGGPGVPNPETKVDYQQLALELEYAFNKRFSVFVEMPYMFINPQVNTNANGWGDMNAGFKYAPVAKDDLFVTFQFRTYVPIGPVDLGTSNGHVSLEPAWLFWKKVGDRTLLEGGVYDWIPINGSDYAGNVLEYGLGVSYYVYDRCKWKIAPVLECVGWSILHGQQTDTTTGLVGGAVGPAVGPGPVVGSPGAFGVIGLPNNNAAGETIVNLKGGLRVDYNEKWSFYVGYGHALTGEQWYRDIIRCELRWDF